MFSFTIDQHSRVPLFAQLKEQVLILAARGLLAADEQMPSVRQVAADLGINPNTVQKAYRELEREGLIYSVPGRGSFLGATDDHRQYLERMLREKLLAWIAESARSGLSPEAIQKMMHDVYRDWENRRKADDASAEDRENAGSGRREES